MTDPRPPSPKAVASLPPRVRDGLQEAPNLPPRNGEAAACRDSFPLSQFTSTQGPISMDQQIPEPIDDISRLRFDCLWRPLFISLGTVAESICAAKRHFDLVVARPQSTDETHAEQWLNHMEYGLDTTGERIQGLRVEQWGGLSKETLLTFQELQSELDKDQELMAQLGFYEERPVDLIPYEERAHPPKNIADFLKRIKAIEGQLDASDKWSE